MNKEELLYELKKSLTIELSPFQLKQIESFCQLLLTENQKYNLTAIKTMEEIYLKHVYDSLTITKAIDLNNCTNLLDIGSGGGFPGIILKIIFPNLNITLLDANNKKIHFLALVKDQLKLDRLNIVHARAEEYIQNHREAFEIVVARAVAGLNVLLELAIPYVSEAGVFIAMKGNIEKELSLGQMACHFLNCQIIQKIEFTLPKENSQRTLLVVKKQGKTSNLYPRTYDKILKNPLLIKEK